MRQAEEPAEKDAGESDEKEEPAGDETEENDKKSFVDHLSVYGNKILEGAQKAGNVMKEQTVKAGETFRDAKERADASRRAKAEEEAAEAAARAADDANIGTVRIADDVVAMIASYAAQEVDGVAGMAGSGTSEWLGRVGVKDPQKGVHVDVNEKNVRVDLSIIIGYGYNIPATSSRVQARVKQAVENMTGLAVTDVNVRIASIRISPESDTTK